MLVRHKVIAAVEELPESFSVEDLFNKVILLEKIERGIRQSNDGQVKTTDEAKALLHRWLQ